jgi:hypothetical protein
MAAACSIRASQGAAAQHPVQLDAVEVDEQTAGGKELRQGADDVPHRQKDEEDAWLAQRGPEGVLARRRGLGNFSHWEPPLPDA